MAKLGPQIRIESEGLGRTTRVIHVESGVDITPCVKSITWRVDGHKVAEVSLELIGPLVDLKVQGVLDSLEVVDLTPQPERIGTRMPHMELAQ